MRTMTVKVYRFDELSEDAKEKARDWWREGGLEYEWWDFIFEDAKEAGKILGIDIKDVYFSGFWSQGDGACFEGSYEYQKGSVKAIKAYAPKDKELHRIAVELSKAQKPYFYNISAHIKQYGQYSHEYCTEIKVYGDGDIGENYINYFVDANTHDTFSELFRDFMRWIYKRLEEEYDYLNSDEQIDESIRINEYEFLEDGSIA